ncbi:MAG: HDOD domain-containing protein [Planctomycetia bacterium]|nr:MAG: HDOD domain-containing protein [Planctomycetia bacterium]
MSLFSRLWNALTGGAASTDSASSSTQTLLADEEELPQRRPAGDDAWWKNPPPPPPAPTASAALIDQTLYDALTRTLDDPEIELPRMPAVADKALIQLRENTVDFRALADVVQQDAALTAQLLRVANSVTYRGFSEIRSLDLAFARLGQRTVRSVILGTTIRALAIRTGGATRSIGEELWRASLAAAAVCGELAVRIGENEDDAFLSGLLHDIGNLGVLRVCYDHAQQRGARIEPPLFAGLAERWHEHLGMRLAGSWGLPDPLPELIGNHHRAPRPGDPLTTRRNMLRMTDVLVAMMGYTPTTLSPAAALDGAADALQTAAAIALGLSSNEETCDWLSGLPDRVRSRVEVF